MTAPADREFRVFQRGEIRDTMLQYFAAGLRNLINPETNALFTEDEIASAIAPGSRWYRQAQAEDDYAQGEQHRALFMNDQLRIDRACTAWLAEYHATLWDPNGRLAATPGSGKVIVRGTDGVHIIGSTTIGDPSAYWGRDPNGNRFQVYDANIQIGPLGGFQSGIATVTMIAMDPGIATNLKVNPQTAIIWSNKDPGMSPQATVSEDFKGGTDVETDAEWADRMLSNIRHKQGGGNDAQHRAWARTATNAVEDAYVYPCAMMAGSVIVALTAKVTRTGPSPNLSPTARIPSPTMRGDVTAYLVPPGSPVEPSPPFLLVVPTQSQPVWIVMQVEMSAGAANGYFDRVPFPTLQIVSGGSNVACVYSVDAGSNSFVLSAPNDAALPAGVTLPKMFVWNSAASSFDTLNVLSVTSLGSNRYQVVCSSLPASVIPLAIVMPQFAGSDNVAQALVAYFDARGPGELFTPTDVRSARCTRFPFVTEEKIPTVGSDVGLTVLDALGGLSINANVLLITPTAPSYPGRVTDGPKMLTLGYVGIYPV